MEKFSFKNKAGEIHWNQRKKLHPHAHTTSYFEAHPNIKLKQALRQIKIEQTVSDILRDSTTADLQRLEIKHINGEK